MTGLLYIVDRKEGHDQPAAARTSNSIEVDENRARPAPRAWAEAAG